MRVKSRTSDINDPTYFGAARIRFSGSKACMPSLARCAGGLLVQLQTAGSLQLPSEVQFASASLQDVTGYQASAIC